MATHANITLRLRHDVFSIEPLADGVRLRVEDMRNGHLCDRRRATWWAATVRARWCAASWAPSSTT